ncbi:MAG: helix-turn-helix domain-containing protein [Deltaproteobacteria bacterium]|jgi:DNA-binding XRE family transcriptional regulator|nr:MAG: helix-turn-helix domain-containing protein [Deltaproteobacteria bacterium]
MKIPTNIQYIEQDGKPVFAVIPYDEYIKLLPSEDVTIPHEVVGLVIKKGMNLVKAWRTYLGITQSEIAKKAGITQAALSQMENTENTLRTATLEKLAKAMGLSVDQLKD